MNTPSQYTPVANLDEKIDIIEHVNEDHGEEVKVIVEYKFPKLDVVSAKIADIFVEGALFDVVTKQGNEQKSEQKFVAFEFDGDLEEQIIYVAYAAMVQQGKSLTSGSKQYFTVVDKQQLTTNFIRLTLKSDEALPVGNVGQYYGMQLTTLASKPKLKKVLPKKKSTAVQWLTIKVNQVMLWAMKKMTKEQRQKTLASMNKNTRLYTMCKMWQSEDSDFVNMGYMDVYTHINADGTHSEGSQWVQALKVGDVIMSKSTGHDKISRREITPEQNTLLIADETAYPALMSALEQWKLSKPPILVLLSSKEDEQAYFTDDYVAELLSSCNTPAQVHRIVGNLQQQEEKLLALLDTIEDTNVVWGAFEYASSKKIRHFLRNHKHLDGQHNLVKGYWKLK